MRIIPPNTEGFAIMTVKESYLACQLKDSSLPPVFSTPMLVAVMENAALNAIKPYFEEHETAVGTAITLKHLAATPLGFNVRATAQVRSVEGRIITFHIEAFDDFDKIGEAVHERTLINLDSFMDRLTKKALKNNSK
ncbi:fluoroacetyl-CoA thioesterase [Ferrovum sp. JA12]|uniref:thioesterase family protein n=1 Tax=Ferrovum sp. JA12 TaxID=1356299 RepID=UPI0007026359|nr:thioesterase family protein [Ferrovum sp. JA12]KRH79939.1 fluoroacetyl-CoA thioesterase [Ferrovum sp. JA12]